MEIIGYYLSVDSGIGCKLGIIAAGFQTTNFTIISGLEATADLIVEGRLC
jgi:hypothetical protein